MVISENLKREFFAFDVIINQKIAKWQNRKHPENSNFQQTVFWAAYQNGDNLVVVYYLDSTAIDKNHQHAILPLNGKTFQEAVYDYWSKPENF